MRLSLPRWGHSADRVVVRSAEAIAYRVPMDLTSEDTTRTTAPFNYLISITGETPSGKTYTGLAEAQPRPNQTDDTHDLSWPFLDAQLKALIGESIHLQGFREDVRHRVARLEDAAGLAEHGESIRFRATLTGLETAMLDLVAKARGLSLADLLGRRSLGVSSFAPLLRHRDPERIVAHFHSRKNYRPDAVRLMGGEGVDPDLEHLRQTAALRKTLRPNAVNAPIWMNFRGRYDLAESQQIVEAVVEWAGGKVLPPHVVLQNLLPRNDQEASPRLQNHADACASAHTAPPDVRILPYNAGPAETERLLRSEEGSLRMLNVRPQQIGGILRTLELTEKIAARAPETQFVLTQFPGASKVTQMVQLDVSKALSSVAHVVSRADVDSHFRVARRDSQIRRTALLREGTGLRINHHALVKRARAQILHPHPVPNDPHATPPNAYDDVDYISPIGAYAVHGHIIEREALARGLDSWRFAKSSFVVSDRSGHQLPFRTARWPLSGVVASSVARHKEATRILLKRAGCPVPEGRTFHGGDHHLALQYAQQIGYPVVLKPAEGSMGAGVTANIPDESELVTALEMLAKSAHGTGEFIVEKHVNGGDYRIMVVGDRVFAAVQRIPANVIGDGRLSIGQLMIAKNMLRRENSHLGPLKIKWNESVRHQLRKQGLSIDTVLPAGQQVFLLSTNNLTQGGDSIEILDDLHPSIQEACVRAVQAIPGMGYCGVDFLLEDHTRPIDEQEAAICELNAMAALPVAEYPMYGTPRRISEEFITSCVDAFSMDAWPERAEHLDLELTIRGGVTGVGYGRWFERRAQKSGLTGWVRSDQDREVKARIAGPTAAVTAMVTLAIIGVPKASPESVRAVHAKEPLDVSGFVLHGRDSDDSGNAPQLEPLGGSDVEDFEESTSRARELAYEDDETGIGSEANDTAIDARDSATDVDEESETEESVDITGETSDDTAAVD